MLLHKKYNHFVKFQEDIIRKVSFEKAKMPVNVIDQDILTQEEEVAKEKLETAIKVTEKHARETAISDVKATTLAAYEDEDETVIKQVKSALESIVKDGVRRLITQEKVRPDGRKIDEIRPLASRDRKSVV